MYLRGISQTPWRILRIREQFLKEGRWIVFSRRFCD